MTSAPSELLPGYRIEPTTGAWTTLPWPSDPDEKQALADRSLGPSLIRWAEGHTDEPGLTDYHTGRPWRFTNGQKRFLVLWYELTDEGRWRYRSAVKRGAKGTGKDPFGASWALLEFIGPSRFVGFDSDGRPVGEPHGLPLVQIAANSEDQAKDVLRIANAMLNRRTREFYNVDVGETRTIIKGTGGRLELLTASEKSSEGDPATAIMLNESHHMTKSSGGHNIARVARRNIGKSPRSIQARLIEFTNAHRQGDDSVAERSYGAWQAQVAGKAKRDDILYDSIEAPPATDLNDDKSRMAGLGAAYSDALGWADLERTSDEILDWRTSVADSVRYYLNGLGAAEDAWIEPVNFDACADPQAVDDGEQIAMFLDCSKSEDATGLVGCRLSDGYVFVLGVWQRPHGDRGTHWLAPREEVDAAARAAFSQYRVAWFGIDPSPATDDDDIEALYWAEVIDKLHRDLGKKVAVKACTYHSMLFDMRLSQKGGKERNKAFTEMAMQVAQEIDAEQSLVHDGNPFLKLHAYNARRRPNQWGVSLGKVNRDSKKHVDLAVCMVGARLGRRLALNSGKVAPSSKVVVFG
jgi:hypothetical protein